MNPIESDFDLSKFGESTPKSTHVKMYERLADSPDSVKGVDKILLVLCTPRCGSTLFAEVLNNTGTMGLCDEWFNYEYFSAWKHVTGSKEFILKDYLKWLLNKTTRETGVFTIKMHIGQLIALNQDFRMGLESMDFDHIIYLWRRDKIAQAVSVAKAVTTNCFRHTEEETSKAVLNNATIADGLANMARFDQFARNHLLGHISADYAYEDFKRLSTPQQKAHESYSQVLTALGIPYEGPFTTNAVKRQFDKRNEDAIRQFRSYILGETR